MKLKYIIHHIIRGCGSIPEYGEHPGVVPMIGFPLFGFIIGLEQGVMKAFVGAMIMVLFFGPMFLYGAYSRSSEQESKAQFN